MHSCAGSSFTPDNRCLLCGHHSNWAALGAPSRKSEPVGCASNVTRKTRLCIACPGAQGQQAIDSFMGLRIAGAVLALSVSCNYIEPPPPDAIFSASNPTRPLELTSNMTIVGPGALRNPIVVAGENVTVSGVSIFDPIQIKGRNALLEDIRPAPNSTALAAAKIVESNVGTTRLRNVRGTTAIVGVGHGEGALLLSDCTFETKSIVSVVLQEAEGAANKLTATPDASCSALPTVNLTRLLNVFGQEYETRYFNDGLYGHTADRTLIFYVLYAVAALLVLTGAHGAASVEGG